MPPHPPDRHANPSDIARLNAAKAGDEDAFAELTLPLQREIHVHCYRMLGSLDDADDALQETLLRAWRRLDRFEPRAPFRAWLYRIATNVCLTMLTRPARLREVPLATPPDAPAGRQEGTPVRLDPYPDRLLDAGASSTPGPDAAVERQEGVALAFVAAVQLLPPRQRAALLLRDGVGYTAAEVAAMLSTTVAATNSVLQRARATLERERVAGRIARPHAQPTSATERALVDRLVAAWQAADVPAIVALLTADALLTMPPRPDRYVGPAAIGAFLATTPAGGRLDQFRFLPTRANRQPAVAAYLRNGASGPYLAHAIVVLATTDAAIASLTRFADPALFPRFGLPPTLDG